MRQLTLSHNGIKRIQTDDPILAKIYQDRTQNLADCLENEYLLVMEDGRCVDQMKWQDGQYKPVSVKPISSELHGKIKPKNAEQICAMDMLADKQTTVKVITGCFGSGKSYLSLAASFNAIEKEGSFEKIVYVRNTIEVKDTNGIGYLKGSYFDKMAVWCGPMLDFLGGVEQLEERIARGQVAIEHLGFLRGRNIANSILYCTEAEHLTREHVQLLLGRVAEGSIVIFDGDFRQIDAKAFEKDNGLQALIDKVSGNKLFSYVHLRESVRSETAKLADLLDVERT